MEIKTTKEQIDLICGDEIFQDTFEIFRKVYECNEKWVRIKDIPDFIIKKKEESKNLDIGTLMNVADWFIELYEGEQ